MIIWTHCYQNHGGEIRLYDSAVIATISRTEAACLRVLEEESTADGWCLDIAAGWQPRKLELVRTS